MTETRFKSDASEAVHSAASGLHRAGLTGKKTMREYDALCIEAVPAFDAPAIARIRQSVNVSQSVFAAYLNTTTSTVRQWEQGGKKPSGMAARLLQLVQKHGLALFS
ncbi:helix-turn-helix domain-containing protein [Ralstonia nicotianae]